jgi:hypothetical protein
MSLYDDIDTDKKSDSVAGWGSGGGSGIKFLQTHMQLKKGSQVSIGCRIIIILCIRIDDHEELTVFVLFL